MRTLYIVGGAMGVGKTTTCRLLCERLENSALLDGDWLWDLHPFRVTDVTKRLVCDNIVAVLNNFLACSELENIVFCWVLHRQDILDGLLSRLHTAGWNVRRISLTCTEPALRARLEKDVRAGLRRPQPCLPAAVCRAGYRKAGRVVDHARRSRRRHTFGRTAMKQKLILITGSPCVGKTAVAERLFGLCEDSAYFDGDWGWCVNPFSLDDPRLRNGDRTIAFALSNYLKSGFRYVICPTVVVIGEEIRASVLRGIDAENYSTVAFTLTCSEETLAARHRKRGDQTTLSYAWLRMPPHPGDYVVDTDGRTPEQVAAELKRIVDAAD